MFICDEVAQHKERATTPRDFSPTLEKGTTNIPKPMPGLVILLYTPPPFMKNDQIKHRSVFHQSVAG